MFDHHDHNHNVPHNNTQIDDSSMKRSLERWRNSFSMRDAMYRCMTIATFSVAILCAGGLLDTVAAVRAGFLPVWGTEIQHAGLLDAIERNRTE